MKNDWFGQALNTASRRPENILPNILLRLQAKQKQNELFKAQHSQSSKISKEVRAIHVPKNTRVTLEFVSQRLDSWQLHLEELSYYLVEGEGAWWRVTDAGQVFEFLDTQNDYEKPKPEHYRAVDFTDMSAAKIQAWERILNSDTLLPTPMVKLYDSNGSFTSCKTFTLYRGSAMDVDMDAETTTLTVHEPNEENMDITNSVNDDDNLPTCTIATNLPMTLEDAAESEVPPTSESTPSLPPLSTKLAKALLKGLKPDMHSNSYKEIQEVDRLRQKIKARQSTKHIPTAILSRYKQLVDGLLQQLQSKKESHIGAIQSFENSYFLTNNALPERQNNSSSESTIYEKNFVSKLIQLVGRDAQL